MPICPGGLTRAKAGVNEFVIYTSGALATRAATSGFTWLIPFIPLLGILPYETQDLCGSEPPGFVAMTGAEVYEAMVSVNITPSAIAAKAKMAQNMRTLAWYTFCECADGSQPVQPAAPAAPVNLPVVLQPAPALNSPCAPVQSETNNLDYASGLVLFTFQPNGYMPTALRLTFDTSVFTAPGCILHVTVNQYTWPNLSVITHTDAYNLALTAHNVRTIVLGANVGLISILLDGTGSSGVEHYVATAEVFCNGEVPGGTRDCGCPPDATILATLDRIMSMVTLIQRQQVPFSYVRGPAHAGLSGSGQFAVSGILGVAVDLTTTPVYFGSRAGDPVTLWTDSWVNLGAADGWLSRERITSDPHLILPREAGALTLVGYTFSPGVVATITELVREP